MKCLILAAGYATRLYPITENFPKPLLEVNGKAILDWLVDDIDTANLVDEYIVISNHKYAHHFHKWAATKQMRITVVDDGTLSNETRLGAIKDILFAIDLLELDDDLLVIAGDNVLDFSLVDFIHYAMRMNTTCIMRYFEPSVQKLSKSGVLEIDDKDRVLSMEEKPASPKSPWCCPPFYYYTCNDAKQVRKAIESGINTDAPGSFIGWLYKQSTIHAMEMPGNRFDIGNLESYTKIREKYRGIAYADT